MYIWCYVENKCARRWEHLLPNMNRLSSLSWHEVRAAFRNIWGYEDFRSPQGEIIRCLLARNDALVIMPTGGGKSICFQLPALLQSGLTLVVSPLVALMENQVQELQSKKLPAALLHGELASYERRLTLKALEQQKLRLLYLSPETLFSPPVWERLIKPEVDITAIILDEAHCLTQWGDTFRPAYRRLGAVRQALLKYKPVGTQISIAAFTATANPLAQQTIQLALGLQKPEIFKLNPYRPNLNPTVRIAWTPNGRKQQLLRFIKARPLQTGLIYVRQRSSCEELAAWLQELGYSTAAYHAGLNAEERRTIEASWLNDKIPFVICTSAFGMGVNKPNVRWVAHFHAPLMLSEYVQEIGRAGRDGKPSEALTLVSEPTGWLDPEDKQRQNFFEKRICEQQLEAQQLVKKLPRQGEISDVMRKFPNSAVTLSLLHSNGQLEWLDPFNYRIVSGGKRQASTHLDASKQMYRYLYSGGCRWKFLLEGFGFGEGFESWRCGHCDNCSRGGFTIS
ncbi:ATP-dependent DNA helicase RecQ [Calothrix sp. NIES-4071]|nr:ATP-dependent DNA helicase RecQ [Calothrix sp. NIES-4071]BAZ56779.1 ATP-dependent DNA helicase RecQ [Calothrix sp. NIES-4105]